MNIVENQLEEILRMWVPEGAATLPTKYEFFKAGKEPLATVETSDSGVEEVMLVWASDIEESVHAEITDLLREIEHLKARVATLEQASKEEEEVITLRDIPKEQAKEEIRQLYSTGETIYMSEVADRLQLPDELVVEICLELQAEGVLTPNDDIS